MARRRRGLRGINVEKIRELSDDCHRLSKDRPYGYISGTALRCTRSLRDAKRGAAIDARVFRKVTHVVRRRRHKPMDIVGTCLPNANGARVIARCTFKV